MRMHAGSETRLLSHTFFGGIIQCPQIALGKLSVGYPSPTITITITITMAK